MNHVIFKGNLVNDTKTMNNQNGGISAFNKIGVYNGKNKNGEQRQSMFFDIVAFNRSAEQLRDMGTKGTPVIVSGRLEEETTVSQTNGQTYVNKRIVCDNVSICVRPIQQASAQQPQYQQPNYAAPQPAYQASVQTAASPW
jgi:single-stranded DNA-binding protein